MGIKYEHAHTVEYDFDTSDITEANRRQVIKLHYDLIKWCETNAKAPYFLDSWFNPVGITVEFVSEEDYQNFLEFSGNNNWIFLHN